MSENKRILGVDYGTVRTGLAVSDELGWMASGIGTFKAEGLRRLVDIISEKVDEYKVGTIVVGNPINMNGSVGSSSEKVSELCEKLRARLDIPVVMFDERCSTMAAHKFLNETDASSKKRRAVIDTLSAQIILQDYLDSHRKSSL